MNRSSSPENVREPNPYHCIQELEDIRQLIEISQLFESSNCYEVYVCDYGMRNRLSYSLRDKLVEMVEVLDERVQQLVFDGLYKEAQFIDAKIIAPREAKLDLSGGYLRDRFITLKAAKRLVHSNKSMGLYSAAESIQKQLVLDIVEEGSKEESLLIEAVEALSELYMMFYHRVERLDIVVHTGINDDPVNFAGVCLYSRIASIDLDHLNDLIIDSEIPVPKEVFFIAAQAGASNLIEKLLSKSKGNVDGKAFAMRSTALHAAVSGHRLPILRKLIESGANLEVRDNFSDTPLHAAIEIQDGSIVKALLEAGAIVNVGNDGNDSPLHYAALKLDVAILHMLLAGGAEVDVMNVDKKTPLVLAIGAQKWRTDRLDKVHKVVDILIDKAGASIEMQGGIAPLTIAAQLGMDHVCIKLLHLEAKIDFRDRVGRTPLQHAVIKNHETTVRILLDAGADPNQHSWIKVNLAAPILHEAMIHQSDLAIVKLLLNAGIDVMQIDRDGRTALHEAIANIEHCEIVVQLLLEKGARLSAPGARGEFGDTLLELVIKCRKPIAMSVLLAGSTASDIRGSMELMRRKGRSAVDFALKYSIDKEDPAYGDWVKALEILQRHAGSTGSTQYARIPRV